MYVHVRKSGQNRYVYIMEAYRNSEGKVAHRTIEKLGRYDVLKQKDPNFLEKLKDNIKLRDQFPHYDKIEQENRWFEEQGLNLSYQQGNSLAYCGMPVYAYSDRVLRQLFRKILNLEYVLTYMQSRAKEKFDFNLATLIYHRILAKLFSGSDCVNGTRYSFIGDVFDLKDEHAYLPQVRAMIGAQQERLLSYLLKKAANEARLPEIARALSELNEPTLKNFISSLTSVPQDEQSQKLLFKLKPFLAKFSPKPASAELSGQSFLNEFEALVSKAMLEIIRRALADNGFDYTLSEIERALRHALMTVYIPPQAADDTLYIKLANAYTELNNRILEAFGFEPPLNCSRKNDLQRSLKIKYCSNRDLLGALVYDRFVIPYEDAKEP